MHSWEPEAGRRWEFKTTYRDFPSSPVVKTPRFQGRGTGSNSGQEAKTPHVSRPKNQNTTQYCVVTNSKKVLKMVQKKKFLKQQQQKHPCIFGHISDMWKEP